jgi:hypothetical protein
MSPEQMAEQTAKQAVYLASRFLTPLRMEVLYGKDRHPYKLFEPLIYMTDEIPGMPEILVPAGYQSDFASVPRLFWRLFPPGGPYRAAAVVHDWLCDVRPKACSHVQAAKVFREAMENLGVGKLTRTAMYNAVRWFGPKFKAWE